MARVFMLRSRADTARWGEALGARLRAGDTVALTGDLGAGKTTLTQSLGRGLGVRGPVTSPTFTLVQEYPGPTPLFHFDSYRLERPEDLADLGFDEYFARGGVVVIEWADKIASYLPPERLEIALEIVETPEEMRGDDALTTREEDSAKEKGGEDEEADDLTEAPRRVTVSALGPRYADLLAELNALPALAALRAASESD